MKKKTKNNEKPTRPALSPQELVYVTGGSRTRGGGDDDPGTIVIIGRDGP